MSLSTRWMMGAAMELFVTRLVVFWLCPAQTRSNLSHVKDRKKTRHSHSGKTSFSVKGLATSSTSAVESQTPTGQNAATTGPLVTVRPTRTAGSRSSYSGSPRSAPLSPLTSSTCSCTARMRVHWLGKLTSLSSTSMDGPTLTAPQAKRSSKDSTAC